MSVTFLNQRGIERPTRTLVGVTGSSMEGRHSLLIDAIGAPSFRPLVSGQTNTPDGRTGQCSRYVEPGWVKYIAVNGIPQFGDVLIDGGVGLKKALNQDIVFPGQTRFICLGNADTTQEEVLAVEVLGNTALDGRAEVELIIELQDDVFEQANEEQWGWLIDPTTLERINDDPDIDLNLSDFRTWRGVGFGTQGDDSKRGDFVSLSVGLANLRGTSTYQRISGSGHHFVVGEIEAKVALDDSSGVSSASPVNAAFVKVDLIAAWDRHIPYASSHRPFITALDDTYEQDGPWSPHPYTPGSANDREARFYVEPFDEDDFDDWEVGDLLLIAWCGHKWQAFRANQFKGVACGLRIEDEEGDDEGKVRIDEGIFQCGLEWDEDECELSVRPEDLVGCGLKVGDDPDACAVDVDNTQIAGSYLVPEGECAVAIDPALIQVIQDLEECCEENRQCCQTLTEIIEDLIECCEQNSACCYYNTICCYENRACCEENRECCYYAEACCYYLGGPWPNVQSNGCPGDCTGKSATVAFTGIGNADCSNCADILSSVECPLFDDNGAFCVFISPVIEFRDCPDEDEEVFVTVQYSKVSGSIEVEVQTGIPGFSTGTIARYVGVGDCNSPSSSIQKDSGDAGCDWPDTISVSFA